MLLTVNHGPKPPRLTVLAYDMACKRRARRVRRLVDSVHHAKQYSVFEALLLGGEFRGLLAELTAYCDLSEDKLAVWWPHGAVRLQWLHGRLSSVACGPRPAVRTDPEAGLTGVGNFVICYDVSDLAALNAVAAAVASEGAMVQRSVYWLRVSSQRLAGLIERCQKHLGGADRLWAYPLRGAHQLWRIGAEGTSLLPMAADRWTRYDR